jgi:hypothetical protein
MGFPPLEIQYRFTTLNYIEFSEVFYKKALVRPWGYRIKVQLKGARSLSDLGLIDCGKASFGRIFRSFSLNSYGYSPQTIEKSASNRLSLVTIA